MRPDDRFQRQPKAFWALTKLVSEGIGYSERARTKPARLKRYSTHEIRIFLTGRGLDPDAIAEKKWDQALAAYSEYRADVLEHTVEPALMTLTQAEREFRRIHRSRPTWRCHIPMNKQSGDKAHPNYLGGMVNMLAEVALDNLPFDSNPRGLITVTRDRLPLRTLARRLDGAIPAINDPIAVWEVKEYYGTTTFGSRVADGIYETQLDGTELVELREVEGVDIKHFLMVDDHFTWWDCGRSYLCRIIDMLHDDLIDEFFFGRQVLDEWPDTARQLGESPRKK